MTQNARIKVLFYVQHLLGLGHLMRASRIAATLQADGFLVTLVTGGVIDDSFDMPGINHVPLPSIALQGSDFSVLVDSDNNPIDEAFKERRCQQLLDIYANIQPTVVILEAYPFGRRQVRFELVPLIDKIEATVPRPVLVASVRDVVQRRAKPGRDEQTAALVKQHFDKVLVHGDPDLAAFGDSFSQASEITDQIIYTGLVFAPVPQGDVPQFDIVVSAGGGAVGFPLISTALEAASLLADTLSWCIVTGPNLPDEQFAQLEAMAPGNVQLERFRDDFIGILSATKLSISQAGYNTVNDVVQAACRSILIPYSEHGETEQTDRALRMSSLGKATVIDELSLSAEQLASVIPVVLEQLPPTVLATQLNGAETTAAILRKLVQSRSNKRSCLE